MNNDYQSSIRKSMQSKRKVQDKNSIILKFQMNIFCIPDTTNIQLPSNQFYQNQWEPFHFVEKYSFLELTTYNIIL